MTSVFIFPYYNCHSYSMLQLLFIITCYKVVHISMVPHLFVIPVYNCSWYFHAANAFLISTWQQPFVYRTQSSQFWITSRFSRLWHVCLLSRSLLCACMNQIQTAVFCPFCIPWRLSNQTRQSKLLSTGSVDCNGSSLRCHMDGSLLQHRRRKTLK